MQRKGKCIVNFVKQKTKSLQRLGCAESSSGLSPCFKRLVKAQRNHPRLPLPPLYGGGGVNQRTVTTCFVSSKILRFRTGLHHVSNYLQWIIEHQWYSGKLPEKKECLDEPPISLFYADVVKVITPPVPTIDLGVGSPEHVKAHSVP